MPQNNQENLNSDSTPNEQYERWKTLEGADKSREVGVKILNTANFADRQKEIIDSSFEKARNKHASLIGKNNERRIDAYIERLNSLVEKGGNRLEQRLWRRSTEKIVIDAEDVDEGYWRAYEQNLRDDGRGHELSDEEKAEKVTEIQKGQRDSAGQWANYLGHENCPFPMWFKVYAWDGMSKLGTFNEDKREYNKRSKSTVAPYPRLDAGVLGQMYDVFCDYYGLGEQALEEQPESVEQDERLSSLVQSGSFNKLYSHFLLEKKVILKTPEKAEDVHGDWREYLPGDEEKLAAAADGTPWCVAGTTVARSYLERGHYGHMNEGEVEESDPENKSKFLLFHLQDSETGRLADNACASVRLGFDGNVEEISGLDDGQALEDSLVSIVEGKVRSLPGGEKFLEAFADKKQLIALDRKMQNGEDPTARELDFLYETERYIATLDTYNSEDPRVAELRKKYDVGYALDRGVDPNVWADILDEREVFSNLRKFMENGVDGQCLLDNLSSEGVGYAFDELIKYGVPPEDVIGKMRGDLIVARLESDYFVREYGEFIDFEKAFREANSGFNNATGFNLSLLNFEVQTVLVKHGIHPDEVLEKINYNLYGREESDELRDELCDLVYLGATSKNLIKQLTQEQLTNNLDIFAIYGEGFSNAEESGLNEIISNFEHIDRPDLFLQCGADPNILMEKMTPTEIQACSLSLIAHGANLGNLAEKTGPVFGEYFHTLFDDLSREKLFNKMVSEENLTSLMHDHDKFADNISANEERLLSEIEDNFNPLEVAYGLDLMAEHGLEIDVSKIVDRLEVIRDEKIVKNLLKYGAHPDDLIDIMPPRLVEQCETILAEYGADTESMQARIQYAPLCRRQ